MRVVTRGDLDGLACALILKRCEKVDSIELVHPQEITERRRIEASLRVSRDELEDRVEERTTELRAALAQTQKDMAERRGPASTQPASAPSSL